MRVSTFFAATLPEAMAKVREALGPKAIVLSWRNTRGGVEISASVQAEYVAPPPVSKSEPRSIPALPAKPLATKREDLLANHFSPDDFLPAPAPAQAPVRESVRDPQPQSRGLAALVGRTSSGVERQNNDRKTQSPRHEAVGSGSPPLGATPRPMVLKHAPAALGMPARQSGAGTAHQSAASKLTAFLIRAGLTSAQAQSFGTSSTPELRRALTDSIAKALVFDPIAAVPTKPLILVGPPGSGKSTCVAKLAARTIASGHDVLLISADSERCGGSDQLAALAKRLGARFEAVTTLADLNELVNEARQRGIVVYVDAPSACPAQPADMRATARMMTETRLEAVLCLPADMRPDDMDDLAGVYQALGIKRAIATRLDLTARRASVLYASRVSGLALAQISASPYISGGVAIATATRLAGLLLDPFEDALFDGALAEDAA